VAELNATGLVIARYVYATRENVPDYIVRSAATYRLITDHLGSVRLVVNAATGIVAQRLDYDGYGRVLNDTNPGFQPFGYAGGLYDPATELVRFGRRDYDPAVGRWTAQDPLGFGGGSENLYTYVGNAPITFSDPTGLGPCGRGTWADGLAGAVGTINNIPNTLFGLAYAGLGSTGGAWSMPGRYGNLDVMNHPLIIPGTALTLGDVTLYGPGMWPWDVGEDGNVMAEHEHQHRLQGRLLGVFYVPSNLAGGAAGLILNGGRWHGPANWNERGPQRRPPRPW
jgi:RHS repeat-associated protein